MVNVLTTFVVSFVIVYLSYYFFIIKKCKKDKKVAPVEVNLILSLHDIDIKKINLYQMIKVVSVVTTFIIALIITLIAELFDNTVIVLVFATLLSIVIAFICYRIIGRHYEKISHKKKKNNNL